MALPTYPFQRSRYWVEPTVDTPARSRPERRENEMHPLLGQRLPSPLTEVQYEKVLAADRFPFIADHRVGGRTFLPAAALLEMAVAAFTGERGPIPGTGTPPVEQVILHEPMEFSREEPLVVQTVVLPGSPGGRAPSGPRRAEAGDHEPSKGPSSLRILSRPAHGEEWTLHLSASSTGVASVPASGASAGPTTEVLSAIRARCPERIDAAAHLAMLRERSLDFGPSLTGLVEVFRRDGESLARVRSLERTDGPRGEDSTPTFLFDPAVLDACLQAVGAALPAGVRRAPPLVPFALDRFRLMGRPGNPVWSHVVLRDAPGGTAGAQVVDLRILDESGRPVAEIEGLRLRPLGGYGSVGDTYLAWLHRVVWRKAPHPGTALVGLGESAAEDSRLAEWRRHHPALETLAGEVVEEAFLSLGWNLEEGATVTGRDLARDWGVAPRHHRLFGRLLEIGAELGILQALPPEAPEEVDALHGGAGADALRRSDPFDRSWRVVRAPRPGMEPGQRISALLRAAPALEGELRLLEACGPELATAIRGETDPLDLLFPGGSMERADRLYRESPAARAVNEVVRDAVGALVAGHGPGARILEVGAGTGGTTASVLPSLASASTEYFFTDVSPAFLARAQEHFGGFDGLRRALFDLEREPEAQGFEARSFDVVLAANVLHATADITSVLRRILRLLVPGGALVLVEGTRPERWVDVTFGLTSGWWRFTDMEVRGHYPLLPSDRWEDLLRAAGFADVTVLPTPGRVDGRAVIVASAAKPVAGAGSWLLVADGEPVAEEVAVRLRARGDRCILTSPEVMGEGPESALDGAVHRAAAEAQLPLRTVLHFVPRQSRSTGTEDGIPAAAHRATTATVSLVQALGRASIPPPSLSLITCGAQPVGPPRPLTLEQAPAWGLLGVIDAEHPGLRPTAIDLDPEGSPEEQARLLVEEIDRSDGEERVAFRGGERYVARLERVLPAEGPDAPDSVAPVALAPSRKGTLEELAWRPTDRRPPGPGEVEIRVSAAALNFRDVMNVLGMRRDRDALGAECSGRVVAVGEGVSDLHIDDEVVAVTEGAFATYAIARAGLTARRPPTLGPLEAAGVPIAHLTARYALLELAGLSPGERVLIHAGAGGVGLAAVYTALAAGAEVLATAGSPEKRAFLEGLGVRRVMDSRSLDFVREVREVTGGEGVHVALNSLSGEFIPATLDALAPDGRFVELGKRDVWSAAQVAERRPGVTCLHVDLAERLVKDPDSLSSLFHDLVHEVGSGRLPVLPVTGFPAARVEEAFRFMAQARHVGKVVVTLPGDSAPPGDPVPSVRPDGTYLVVGGLGGLGLLAAGRLVERGARNLVLMGRSAPGAEAAEHVRTLEEKGVRVVAVQGDVSDPEDVRAVMERIRTSTLPLRGVVHAAGVLDDRTLLLQERGSLERVLAPKVDGAWNLHLATRDEPLDFFVLYASTAGLLARPGQGVHAAANAFLDALAHHRNAGGQPALSIDWGVWRDVGAAARRGVDAWVASVGVGSIPPAEGLRALDGLLMGKDVQVAVLPIDWGRFLEDPARAGRWLSGLRPPGRASAPSRPGGGADPASDGSDALRSRLASAPAARRRELLLDLVLDRLLRVIGLDGAPDIDPRQPLADLGVDSLMAVELRNLLARSLGEGVALPATMVFDHPTPEALARFLEAVIFGAGAATGPDGEAANGGDLLEEIENLSDEDVRNYLAGRNA
ncbi:MAG: SDR family NAD(P)-dependent oxidoreductase [Gemmatimonadales bacterium]|nr:MAG: SDR family NAD(P)-dependent oxidoreductase [Gemmatimonadales bacterium]